MTKESLEKMIEEYFYWLTYIDSCFELHEYLYSAEKQYLAQMNIAPAFFQLSRSALIHTAIIDLSKFYDKDKRAAISLRKLLVTCKENKSLFKKKYFEDNSPLLRNAFTDGNNIDMDKILQGFFDCLDGKDGGKLPEYVTKLKELRDKKLAHLDENADEFISCKGGLTRIMARTLIDTAIGMCRKLSVCLTGKDNLCQSSNALDVEDLLKKLKEINVGDNYGTERRKQ